MNTNPRPVPGVLLLSCPSGAWVAVSSDAVAAAGGLLRYVLELQKSRPKQAARIWRCILSAAAVRADSLTLARGAA
ncbi:hypothetical protein KUW19_00710 [Ferrimonas balearica]|uniref:hypothetical protein n=1 Tax=Ferrimonas balearica TaxID=44012 RepID=UPI001C94098F|nr:hypothetical protein [Ferrimonas balearica]MBY6104997.1 hypothetical protein [Ferrimonas balearica]